MIVLIAITSLYALLILALLVGLVRTIGVSGGEKPVYHSGISVVVAFRNERQNISKLLEALLNQTLSSQRWEVIFVDDCSSDNGGQLVLGAGLANIRYIGLPHHVGKKLALIEGVGQARYSLVAFTDADCEPCATWLEHMLCVADNHAIMQGAVTVDAGCGVVAMFDALDYASLMATAAGSFGLRRPVVAASANIVFRKDMLAVDKTSLHTKYVSGDDMFLLHSAKRLSRASLRFVIAPAAHVKTRFDGGFKAMIRRRTRWASKSLGYRDFDTIMVALVVLLFNLTLVLIAVTTLTGATQPTYLLAVWAVKVIVDALLLAVYLKKTSQLRLLWVYLPLQLVYPFYTVFAAIAGVMRSVKWK